MIYGKFTLRRTQSSDGTLRTSLWSLKRCRIWLIRFATRIIWSKARMGSCLTPTGRIRGGTSRVCIMRVRGMIRGMGILVLRRSRWGQGWGRRRLGCFRTGLSRCSKHRCRCTEGKIHWILLCSSRLDMIRCFQLEKRRLILLETDMSLHDLICSNPETRFLYEIIDLFLQLSTDFL